MYLCKLNNVSTIHGNLVSTKSLTNHTIIVDVVNPNATINDKSTEIDLGMRFHKKLLKIAFKLLLQ